MKITLILLVTLFRTKNLKKSVTIWGEVDENTYLKLFDKADIFTFGNIDQSWGLAVFEAMSCGLPTIVSNSFMRYLRDYTLKNNRQEGVCMKYLILGAGPAGLSFANRLKQNGEKSYLVLEKEIEAGGLCRSVNVDDFPFDIGGGHFLDVRRPKVNEFLFSFMPEEEWKKYDRDSRIVVNGNTINHPIEANIWQMKVEDQVEYLKSIAAAGCNLGMKMPNSFVDWIYWKLGSKIAEDYMIPYNQ